MQHLLGMKSYRATCFPGPFLSLYVTCVMGFLPYWATYIQAVFPQQPADVKGTPLKCEYMSRGGASQLVHLHIFTFAFLPPMWKTAFVVCSVVIQETASNPNLPVHLCLLPSPFLPSLSPLYPLNHGNIWKLPSQTWAKCSGCYGNNSPHTCAMISN